MSGVATKPLLATIIFFASASLALGQAGSTGGTIGKTDKSISGGQNAAGPNPPTSSRSNGQRPVERGASAQSSEAPVAGRWRWIADCAGQPWRGVFDLVETSRGHFNGNFAGTSWHDVGTITDGQVNGTSVTFTRTGQVVQYWRGQLAARRIKGTLSGNATCSWEATRK